VDVPGHLANLDLNLLVFLRELIGERNVTRAAARIGVSQPAASAALARLRRHFGDELLVRRGAGYELTPLGGALAAQVEPVAVALERLFATRGAFDPTTSRREFSVLLADYAVEVLGEELSRLMVREAPGIRLHVRLVRESMSAEVEQAVRVLDAVVAPPVRSLETPEIRSMELFRDRWVCAVDPANTRIGDAPTVADLADVPWVLAYHRAGAPTSEAPATRRLDRMGVRPEVAVRVESYLALPAFVRGTDRVALVQERLAARWSASGDHEGLRVVPCPGEPDPIIETLWWHDRLAEDPAHRWFREALLRAAHQCQ
jgi:DNA-binding transcriptional LysR family regulator